MWGRGERREESEEVDSLAGPTKVLCVLPIDPLLHVALTKCDDVTHGTRWNSQHGPTPCPGIGMGHGVWLSVMSTKVQLSRKSVTLLSSQALLKETIKLLLKLHAPRQLHKSSITFTSLALQ